MAYRSIIKYREYNREVVMKLHVLYGVWQVDISCPTRRVGHSPNQNCLTK